MENYFVDGAERLLKDAKEIVNRYSTAWINDKNIEFEIPEEFRIEFFRLIDRVSLSLMEDRDNFYGYFLFQMTRDIRFDIGSPTGVVFKGAGYVINFNPLMYLMLSKEQMQTAIKHEILHILSLHLIRAKSYLGSYNDLAVNMAMDVVVNRFLDYLPPYATTLEWVNVKYGIQLKVDETFESYLEKIQAALNQQEETDDEDKDHSDTDNKSRKADLHDNNLKPVDGNDTSKFDLFETEYNVEKTHAIWNESEENKEKVLLEFTEKAVDNAMKGELPSYLSGLIEGLKNSGGELPWNLYLNRLMGTMESRKKKTVTRRNRRQPQRMDLRGELRDHKANLIVALDISGSISDEEFLQAMKEVLSIVRNYKHEITVVECDDEIRRSYKVKTEKDIRERFKERGATKFSPVISFANSTKVNLLVYFTDGKGEEKLETIPRGYKILWVISGRGDRISLREHYGVVKKLKNITVKDVEPELADPLKSGFSMMNQEEG